ncbi:MAG: YihY/virulence factor BrkB family protein [Acidobacteriota bacterium]
MLKAIKVPIGWKELAKRTVNEVIADNCLNLAAQLAYYFFLALFPALLVLVAIVSYIPVEGLLDMITSTLARVAPGEVITIVQDQILKVANDKNGGLLTVGLLGTIWSTSSGVDAIISTLNSAYDIQESRPWWRVKLTAIGLTLALAVFIVLAFVLLLVGPTLAETVASWFYLGPAFVWSWKILQWPVVFGLVTLAVALIYYYAPDAKQEWTWITPGSLVATLLWLLTSLGFKFYVSHFAAYNATYGAIGGVIVLMLWFYVSSLAVLIGAELNAEIEHASPDGKDPGEKVKGEKKVIGARAEGRDAGQGDSAGLPSAAPAFAGNCGVDADLDPARPASLPPARASDWLIGGLVLGEAAILTYAKLRPRFKKVSD